MNTNIKYKVISNLLELLPDQLFLRLMYYRKIGKRLNLKNPKTYNEKIQWLKLYDKNSLYSNLVDKYEVRKYISEKIGEEYLIPLLGVYNNFEEIDFDQLPNEFVLKTTHDLGGVVICKNKSTFDKKKAEKKLKKSLNNNYYYMWREKPYKNIKPKIICEKLMVDESGVELKDYKFFCFNGDPKALFVASNRGIDTRFDFFDIDFNRIPITKNHYINSNKSIKKPKGFEKMVDLSNQLSKGFPHIRVDFYNINGKIYFGELTLYHFSGFERFEPENFDNVFGEWLELPPKNKL